MFLGIDDLDYDGKVLREAEQVHLVQHGVGTEPGDALNDGGAGEVFRSEQLEERRVQRAPLPLVRLTNEDPHQDLFAFDHPHSRPPVIPRVLSPMDWSGQVSQRWSAFTELAA
jgi:hypothetical protein